MVLAENCLPYSTNTIAMPLQDSSPLLPLDHPVPKKIFISLFSGLDNHSFDYHLVSVCSMSELRAVINCNIHLLFNEGALGQ